MDVVERLTLEAAQADTMIACEHRQRYEFAAGLCAGRRVLDLCCGSGYGSAILAVHAREVTGVDNDAATVETALVTVGLDAPNVSFELADAVAFLGGDIAGRFDVVVCFEGLEHLQDLDRALALLREYAERGAQIVASVPNGKLFGERNRFHVTQFGYDEAIRAFADFPSVLMLPQFLAEGSLICPTEATETEVSLTLEDRNEPECANHFIFCAGFDPTAIERAHQGKIQVYTSPMFNRWAEDVKQGVMGAPARERPPCARSARQGGLGRCVGAGGGGRARSAGRGAASAVPCRRGAGRGARDGAGDGDGAIRARTDGHIRGHARGASRPSRCWSSQASTRTAGRCGGGARPTT